jgi:hypothetical protein
MLDLMVIYFIVATGFGLFLLFIHRMKCIDLNEVNFCMVVSFHRILFCCFSCNTVNLDSNVVPTTIIQDTPNNANV